ncbi:MAG: anthranilate phosphoribosyltransferase, partial [Sedimentisphaerales bacterium]|nr:anthranilate phosphoribosyltransferase [Sedimentisphaerales bacterium]
DPGPNIVAECIREAHIGFMFAPKFHPAMRFVQPIRKSLDFRTAFNILGPLANPAGAAAQVMGVAEEALLDRICETLKMLGVKRAMVVHGQGMDEISTLGITQVRRLNDGEITSTEIDPADLGFAAPSIDELKTGDAIKNAAIIRDILTGKERGPRRDIVILNAAAAIIVACMADDFPSAVELARDAIANGAAADCLDKLIEASNKA